MAYDPNQPANKPFASRKRLRKDRFIGRGKGVVVTNPAAGPTATARRTPSLGMGGIEQYNKL